LPNETIGVGESFDFQLLIGRCFISPKARFGWRHRQPHGPGYVSEASCGEILLIYRLTLTDAPLTGDNAVSPRLPMTLNVVLKAKDDHAFGLNGTEIACSRSRAVGWRRA